MDTSVWGLTWAIRSMRCCLKKWKREDKWKMRCLFFSRQWNHPSHFLFSFLSFALYFCFSSFSLFLSAIPPTVLHYHYFLSDQRFWSSGSWPLCWKNTLLRRSPQTIGKHRLFTLWLIRVAMRIISCVQVVLRSLTIRKVDNYSFRLSCHGGKPDRKLLAMLLLWPSKCRNSDWKTLIILV